MNTRFLAALLLLTFAFIIPGKTQTPETEKIEKDIFVKKVSGYNIVYDCYGRRETSTDSIIVYAKKPKVNIKLLTYEFDGNYIESVTIKYFLNHPFIYITANHTYGHFIGELYALDLVHFKTKEVKTLNSNIKNKAPHDLEFRKNNGIRIENNKIMNGAYYRNSKGANYAVDYELRIKKIGYNSYGLIAIKQIVRNDGD
jgi:hypothetical protein